jgi:hypothetical protein
MVLRSKPLHSAAWLCGLALAASTAAHAASTASSAVLVELFTSEGCSSCPPADRLLAQLDRQQPVPGTTIVVLSEHVDYWNQLGWRDPYSSSLWSERQQDYARHFNLDSVYTPQIVVDGARQAAGSDSRAVLAAIERSAAAPRIDIAISRLDRSANGLKLLFAAGPGPGTGTATALYAVLADDADRSSVQRGENAGRTLEHVAVARSLVHLADLSSAPLTRTAEIPLPQGAANRRLRLVLFARDEKSGRIVGVAAREI